MSGEHNTCVPLQRAGALREAGKSVTAVLISHNAVHPPKLHPGHG